MKDNRTRLRWKDIPITAKVLLTVATMTLIMFLANIAMYVQVNRLSGQLQQVYTSNVSLTELSGTLDDVQNNTYSYLLVKSSDVLESYYKSVDRYRRILEQLNSTITEDPVMLLEKNIRSMSEQYLSLTEEAITLKRGRNVEKYSQAFDKAQELYGFLNTWIYELNSRQFRNNSDSFQSLKEAIRPMAFVSTILILIIMSFSSLILYFMLRGVARPLSDLASTARIVGEGNFRVKMPQTDAKDEVGVVTRTFNSMVTSLEDYVNLTRENLEKEQEMKERELRMETHLKEAQLKYLQSQINPHFLFNSLNAGAQLAVMEDAEQTGIFLQRMADFFRYNVKKGTEDTTLEEEIDSVENYIYILNVRFAGDIHFEKEVDEEVLSFRMPSMILQPMVENAVNHGIRNIDWEGHIHLAVYREEDTVCISVADNGKGMTEERIREVLSGLASGTDGDPGDGDSTGIGIINVIRRLELYYDRKDLMAISSEGEGKGTEIILRLPIEEVSRSGEADVSDFTGR